MGTNNRDFFDFVSRMTSISSRAWIAQTQKDITFLQTRNKFKSPSSTIVFVWIFNISNCLYAVTDLELAVN